MERQKNFVVVTEKRWSRLLSYLEGSTAFSSHAVVGYINTLEVSIKVPGLRPKGDLSANRFVALTYEREKILSRM